MRKWLNERRAEVLRLRATTSLSNREIAEKLGVTTYRVWRDINAAEKKQWIRKRVIPERRRQTKCSWCVAKGRKTCIARRL